MKIRKLCTIVSILTICVFSFVFTGCPPEGEEDGNGTTPGGNPNQTPTAEDFIISGTGAFTFDGNPKTVTVTAKEGKTTGAITVIKYNGNANAPSLIGTYTVTFDVAAATGWNSASGLSAGTLTIIAADPSNQIPTAADFNISGTGKFTFDSSPKTVTVTAKTGKTTGTITVKYNGIANAPSAVGTYDITFDVTAVTGWNSASGLSAGTLMIYENVIEVVNLQSIIANAPDGVIDNTAWGTIFGGTPFAKVSSLTTTTTTFTIITEGGVKKLKIDNMEHTWGEGLDIRHANDGGFVGVGYKVDDEIYIKGTSEPAGIFINSKGGAYAKVDNWASNTTAFEKTVTLTAGDITNIMSGSPQTLRLHYDYDRGDSRRGTIIFEQITVKRIGQ